VGDVVVVVAAVVAGVAVAAVLTVPEAGETTIRFFLKC
jgi:type III secretory pathway component EscS